MPRFIRHAFPILCRLGRSNRGTAAVEFALISPVMVLLLAGIVDYGLGVHYLNQLQDAVRAGAEYALRNPADTDGITSTITGSTTLTGIVVTTPTSSCKCIDGTSVSCTGTCASGIVGHYTDIRATYTYTSLFTLTSSTPTTIEFALSVRTQ